MLDPHYLLTVGDSLANQFFELETEILIDIAKRLKANDLNMVSTAQYQIMKLQQLGLQTDYINQMLAQLLGVSEEQVAQIMSDSAYESIREDMKIYQEADMLDGRTVDLTEQVKAGTNALKGELTNLCQTTVQTANKRYMDLLDKAYLSVSSGLLSPQQATDQAIKELAKDGLQMVDYKSGARRQLDSAVRVAVRTATTKNACACQEQVMDDLDVNLVEVSSHMGARPSHAKWQGKIYWRKKKYGNYKNFEQATRYGHGDGLGGWNCRHQFYPYIPGVSEKTYEPYRLGENKEQYELEQKQRYNERMIREWKRREQIMKAAGLDSTYEGSKVKEWQKKNKALIDAHSDILKRDYGREKAYLANPKKAAKKPVSKARANYMTKYDDYPKNWEKVKPLKKYDDLIVHSDGKDVKITMDGYDLEYSTEDFFNQYYKESYDYRNSKKTGIRLLGCSAGKYDDGVAQQLADLTGKTVRAPTQDILCNSDGELLITDSLVLQDFFASGMKVSSTGTWRTFKPRRKEDKK